MDCAGGFWALHRIMGMALHHQIEALNHYAWVANQNWQKSLLDSHGLYAAAFCETYGLIEIRYGRIGIVFWATACFTA